MIYHKSIKLVLATLALFTCNAKAEFKIGNLVALQDQRRCGTRLGTVVESESGKVTVAWCYATAEFKEGHGCGIRCKQVIDPAELIKVDEDAHGGLEWENCDINELADDNIFQKKYKNLMRLVSIDNKLYTAEFFEHRFNGQSYRDATLHSLDLSTVNNKFGELQSDNKFKDSFKPTLVINGRGFCFSAIDVSPQRIRFRTDVNQLIPIEDRPDIAESVRKQMMGPGHCRLKQTLEHSEQSTFRLHTFNPNDPKTLIDMVNKSRSKKAVTNAERIRQAQVKTAQESADNAFRARFVRSRFLRSIKIKEQLARKFLKELINAEILNEAGLAAFEVAYDDINRARENFARIRNDVGNRLLTQGLRNDRPDLFPYDPQDEEKSSPEYEDIEMNEAMSLPSSNGRTPSPITVVQQAVPSPNDGKIASPQAVLPPPVNVQAEIVNPNSHQLASVEVTDVDPDLLELLKEDNDAAVPPANAGEIPQKTDAEWNAALDAVMKDHDPKGYERRNGKWYV